MTNMVDAIEYAKNKVISDLCSGRNFDGLGSMAQAVIYNIAQGARDNAQIFHPNFHGPADAKAYNDLKDACVKQFVLDVLGMGDEKLTLFEATEQLVETVYEQYDAWARAVPRKDMSDPAIQSEYDDKVYDGAVALAVKYKGNSIDLGSHLFNLGATGDEVDAVFAAMSDDEYEEIEIRGEMVDEEVYESLKDILRRINGFA